MICRRPPPPPQGLEERLGGTLGVLRCMARCLLVAGAKSYTHMVIALERYYGPLKNAVDAGGLEVRREEGVVCVVVAAWPAGRERGCQEEITLLSLRLLIPVRSCSP